MASFQLQAGTRQLPEMLRHVGEMQAEGPGQHAQQVSSVMERRLPTMQAALAAAEYSYSMDASACRALAGGQLIQFWDAHCSRRSQVRVCYYSWQCWQFQSALLLDDLICENYNRSVPHRAACSDLQSIGRTTGSTGWVADR